MRWIAFAIASVMLSSACVTSKPVILDPRYPHRVAKESEITIWVRLPDGSYVQARARLMPGDWCAPAATVEDFDDL